MIGKLLRSPFFWLLAGFLVWSLCFVLLYAFHALGCDWGWSASDPWDPRVHRMVLYAMWVLHLALLGGLLALSISIRKGSLQGGMAAFRGHSAFALTLAAGVATIWIGTPLLTLQTCV